MKESERTKGSIGSKDRLKSIRAHHHTKTTQEDKARTSRTFWSSEVHLGTPSRGVRSKRRQGPKEIKNCNVIPVLKGILKRMGGKEQTERMDKWHALCIMKQIKTRLWKQIQTIFNPSIRPSFFSNKSYLSHTFIQPYHRDGWGKEMNPWAHKDDSLTHVSWCSSHMTVGQDAFESGRGVMATRKKKCPFFWKVFGQRHKESGGEVPFLGCVDASLLLYTSRWCDLTTHTFFLQNKFILFSLDT